MSDSFTNAWIGLRVETLESYATVIDDEGNEVFSRTLLNESDDILKLFGLAAEVGKPALAIARPGPIATTAFTYAMHNGVTMTYIPEVVLARQIDYHRHDPDIELSFLIADTARRHSHRLHWLPFSPQVAGE